MGTSSSGRGPGSGSPLVPSWAEPLSDDPQTEPAPGPLLPAQEDPLPESDEPLPPSAPATETPRLPFVPPDVLRLTGFRRTLGNAIARGPSGRTSDDFRRALRTYAKATGGGKVAARRLGSASAAGARIYSLFSTGTAVGPRGQTLNLASLAGRDIRVVIDRIVDTLVSNDGDREKITVALQAALPQALNGVETFDPAAVEGDVLIDMMVIYTQECVFQQVVADSDRAFQRNPDPDEVGKMENELHSLVVSVVGQQMRSLFGQGPTLTEAQARDVQSQAIRQTWDFWEARDR